MVAFMSGNEGRTSTEEKNRKDIGEMNIAKLDRPMNSIDKEKISLTEEETREYFELLELEKGLDRELSDLRRQEKEFRSTEETMNLLHKYNDIKDATQTVMGAIAIANRTTVKNLYQHYGLSAEED
ncbi:DNA repair protein SWI5 homolog [Calliopsis andreniformis]|uniref:DNA repair protein SWI5 homolog n=1 Tax=Calliopsis andreniformis TaxID=337506 RepID=UPI003FCE8284